jgi:Two component regulator propeller
VTVTAGKRSRNWLIAIIAIVLIATLLRGWAVLRLPLDFDEPTYLEAAFDYARLIRAGDLNGVIDYPGIREHPALVKLLYGLVVLALGPNASWAVALYLARGLSAVFGILACLVLALFDPLAGGLLAVHTMAIKYTSQAYLEALPLLATIGAVLALNRAKSARDGWFWVSALALGATAAGKYTYFPVVVPILYVAIWDKRVRWQHLVLYLAVAAVTFWALDPTLWHQPLTRLIDSLLFHVRYSQGTRVELANLPWYRPLYWISRAPASEWHPDVFFYPALDGLIFFLALPGLYLQWRERRWVVLWFAAGLLFLLVWPTKWPQYTLVLTPALCLSASSTLTWVYRWLREQENYWSFLSTMIPRPPLAFWILLGAAVLAIAVGYSAYTLQLTLGKLGWSHFGMNNTPLPSNTVYSLVAGAGEEMILGTEQGAAIWAPPPATDLPDLWQVFTTANSGLPGNRVLSVARDEAGNLWFGTETGLGRYDGSNWKQYRAADLGLAGDSVYALAVGSDGRLWVGTNTGVAALDGETWHPYTSATSGLGNDWVLSLAVEGRPQGDRIWFGTRTGVSRLDTASGEWDELGQGFDAQWGGVDALLVDSRGRVWAGTVGGGLGLWDGAAWQFYNTGNSGLPYNTVKTVAEVRPGVLWVGTAAPMQVGGALSEFDGQTWRAYTPQNSGFSGAEPLTMAQDAQGRWWIGTRTARIDIYQPKH